MLRTVHGVLLAVIVTVLCSGTCGLQIDQEDAVAVTDKFPYNNLDLDSLHLVESSIPIEDHVKFIPEDDIGEIVTAVEGKQGENVDLLKDANFGGADVTAKHRMIRQANHQYSPLYPKLPSGPPYNNYQPQPINNPAGPYGQNPNQQQPGYNPYGQNTNQQQPSYNPYTQNPNQQQPSYNPYTQNPNQQQPSYNPYTQNPNQQQPSYNPYTQNPNRQQPIYNPYTPTPNQQQPTFKPAGQNQLPTWNSNSLNSSQPGNSAYNNNHGPYNPSSGQNPYNPRPSSPYNNSTSPVNTYRPPNGQYSPYNQTFNPLPNTGSYRPSSGSNFTTPYPTYNPRPGQSPYNNYPPSTGNSHSVQPFNSSSQQPYYNPSQYPSYNNSRPNPTPGSSSTNSQYPNYPGVRPSQGPYNVTLPKTPQSSPYFPGPNGQIPSNSYNPSIPNYPPQNQGQNNFYYPQNNNTASYDPRRVPSQNFSYH